MQAIKYYFKDEATGKLERLVPPIRVEDGRSLIHPSPEQWSAHDPPAYPKSSTDSVPTPPEGKIARMTGWEVSNGEWVRTYEFVDKPMPTLEEYDNAMEGHLREEREARGYTLREPNQYKDSSVPRWKQDAMDWITHLDEVMLYGLEVMNSVQSGQREPPTMDEFVAGLPRITWTYEGE